MKHFSLKHAILRRITESQTTEVCRHVTDALPRCRNKKTGEKAFPSPVSPISRRRKGRSASLAQALSLYLTQGCRRLHSRDPTSSSYLSLPQQSPYDGSFIPLRCFISSAGCFGLPDSITFIAAEANTRRGRRQNTSRYRGAPGPDKLRQPHEARRASL